ncbi:MAG: alpha/beta fold hydrolase [Opitutaceae bacterium]|nr:alpha/beta fold hydrolase [Opitutaceae bacterium]
MPDLLASFLRIFGLLVVAYACAAVGAHFLSLNLIFPRPPVKYEVNADYISLRTPDGVTLQARHWPNPQARHTLLYLHGNYEDLGTVGEVVPGFLAAGYAVFALDYRGYGHSGGRPSEANTCADVELAYDHLRQRLGVPPERIVIFGYSLGAGPGVELASRRPAAGLVMQGAFVSAYRVMTRIPLFPGDKFLNLDKVPHLTLPVMVIHGTADETVPSWHGERLYAALTSRKARYFIPGGPHSGIADFAGPRYWEELRRFTDSL